MLTEYFHEQTGWQVTPSVYEIPTAFVAVFDCGKLGPVVSFNAEYDALKGIGHACGHSLIAVASVAGAIAVARIVQDEDLSGKVFLFGTPAEGKSNRDIYWCSESSSVEKIGACWLTMQRGRRRKDPIT